MKAIAFFCGGSEEARNSEPESLHYGRGEFRIEAMGKCFTMPEGMYFSVAFPVVF